MFKAQTTEIRSTPPHRGTFGHPLTLLLLPTEGLVASTQQVGDRQYKQLKESGPLLCVWMVLKCFIRTESIRGGVFVILMFVRGLKRKRLVGELHWRLAL